MDTNAGPPPPGPAGSPHRTASNPADPQLTGEFRAAVEARRELGPEYEPALVESFLDRLDESIDRRVESRLAERAPARPARRGGIDGGQLAMGIVSVALGIPLTAITLLAAGSLVAMVIVWVGIVIVNIAVDFRR